MEYEKKIYILLKGSLYNHIEMINHWSTQQSIKNSQLVGNKYDRGISEFFFGIT